ncbi:transmembrane protein, putative (macronuclear) [Tetrahymena thermophila SB210]|uniref:Transmembrane protein, putative n=1 Tax=Tetrahymena thermophila (strain SB210) TaxID=312017 RepID=Q22P39_TETTS|nr:transmembrane protein, putative [Tetrahymena thermophila SB210]EAR86972.2 transmembrane protein, putative [Tetrahymena thermophila SB210]|eukprot:XP_001007217.2 transmembrane protein, putative [Tetrahymena thermophila SB210]
MKSKKDNNSSIYFSYLHFLIEFSQSRVLSLCILSQIKQSNRFSLRELMYLYYLTNLIRQKFLNHNNSQQEDFGVALKYEEALIKIFFQYENCIIKKLEMVHTLNKDFINLESFLDITKRLYTEKQELFQQLKEMAQVSHKNYLLREMINGYVKNLSFIELKRDFISKETQSQKLIIQQQIKERNLMKKQQLAKQQRQADYEIDIQKENHQLLIQQIISIYNDNQEVDDKVNMIKQLMRKEKISLQKQKKPFEIDQYDQNSCTIFMKLNGSDLGEITKVQQSFFKIFGIENIVGAKIDRIIPPQIAKYHQKLLEEYLTNISNQQNQIQSKNLLVAQDKQGWAVPIRLKFQIDYLTQSDQAGFIALIQKIDTENLFILTDCTQFRIFLCSELLHEQIFSQFLSSINQIYSIYLTRVMPILLLFSDSFIQEQEKNQNIKNFQSYFQENQTIQSLAFFPANSSKENINHLLKKPLELKDLQKYFTKINNSGFNIYQVKFQIHKTQNKFFKNNIIEIIKIRKFKKNKEIFESIQQLTNQFNLLCNIDIKFDYLKFERNTLSAENTTLNSKEEIQSLKQCEKAITDFNKQRTIKQSNFQIEFCQPLSSLQHIETTTLPSPQKVNQKPSQLQDELEITGILSQTNLVSPKFLYPLQSPNASQIQLVDKSIQEDSQIMNQLQPLKQQNQGITNESVRIKQFKNLFEGLKPGQKRFSNLVQQVIQYKEQLLHQDSILRQESTKINSMTFDHMLSLGNSNNILSHQSQEDNSKQRQEQQNQLVEALKDNDYQATSIPQLQRQVDHFEMEASEAYSSLNRSKTLKSGKTQTKSNVKVKSNKINQNEKQSNFQLQTSYKEGAESSIKSGQSYTNEAKKIFAQKILSKKKNVGIQVLYLAGLASLCIILSLTVASYFSIYDLFQQEKVDFKNVAWPMQLRSTLSLEVFYLQYVRFYQHQVFPQINNQQWDNFIDLNQKRIVYLQDVYYEQYIDFLRSDKTKYPYFKNLTEFQFTYILNKDDFSYPNITYPVQGSFQYFLNMLYIYSRRFAYNLPNTFNEEGMINENFGNYDVPLTQLQTDIEQRTLTILDQIEQGVQTLMILVMCISFVLIAIVFPVYYYVQTKIEAILKLFSTFTTENLQQIIQSCQFSLQRIQYIKSKNPTIQKSQIEANMVIRDEGLKKLEIQGSKRKNISATSQIVKVPYLLIISSLFVYVIIIVQPIVNNSLIQSLTQESRINLELMKTIYDMKAHFASVMYLHYAYILEVLCDECVFYDRGYFKVRIPLYQNINTQKLNGLYQVVQKEVVTKRYNQQSYDNFFFKMLQGNICEAMQEYPKYLTDPLFKFDFSTCSNIRYQLLTKGFQIATKDLLEQFTPLSDILEQPDRNKAKLDLIQWQQQINMIELDIYTDYLINTVTALKNFMIEMSDDYLSYVQKVQLYLLIFYCFSIIFLFCFIWLRFYDFIHKSLYSTKQLLSLIDVLIVIQNPYVMNYINDH